MNFCSKNMSVAFRNKCGNLILPVDFGSKKVHGFGRGEKCLSGFGTGWLAGQGWIHRA